MSCSIPACLMGIVRVSVKCITVSAELVVFSSFEHMQEAANGDKIQQWTFLRAASSGTSLPRELCGGGELWSRAVAEGEVLEEEEKLSILPFPLSTPPSDILVLWRGWG